jgi:hypothetical protein
MKANLPSRAIDTVRVRQCTVRETTIRDCSTTAPLALVQILLNVATALACHGTVCGPMSCSWAMSLHITGTIRWMCGRRIPGKTWSVSTRSLDCLVKAHQQHSAFNRSKKTHTAKQSLYKYLDSEVRLPHSPLSELQQCNVCSKLFRGGTRRSFLLIAAAEMPLGTEREESRRGRTTGM